jgi:hypothetical protein
MAPYSSDRINEGLLPRKLHPERELPLVADNRLMPMAIVNPKPTQTAPRTGHPIGAKPTLRQLGHLSGRDRP